MPSIRTDTSFVVRKNCSFYLCQILSCTNKLIGFIVFEFKAIVIGVILAKVDS